MCGHTSKVSDRLCPNCMLASLRLRTSAVASKRLCDVVPMTVDEEFLRAFENSSASALMAVDRGEESCRRYLMEPRETRDRREELSSRKGRLESAKDML